MFVRADPSPEKEVAVTAPPNCPMPPISNDPEALIDPTT